MKSAVTLSLVPEARGGPFVYRDDPARACEAAARLGFDAIEIFPPSATALREMKFSAHLNRHGLKAAAVGSGGGWVRERLSLTAADPSVRDRARRFIAEMIDAAAELGAPVIVGSMQGCRLDGADRASALARLAEALHELAGRARGLGMRLLYEPLNRFETDLCNTLADGAELLAAAKSENLRLLADLFHMNIEEANLADSVRAAGGAIGHFHLADSNRRPAGCGHTDIAPVAAALREIGFDGYVSAECLPWPDPDAAAERTVRAIRRFFS